MSESAIGHLLFGEISFSLVKVSSSQDLLSSEILTLLGKTARWLDHYYKTKCVFSGEDAP